MSDFVCGPLPFVAHFGVFLQGPLSSTPSDYSNYIAQEPKAWPSHGPITYSFVQYKGDGKRLEKIPGLNFDHDERVLLVKEAAAILTRYANVSIVPVAKDESKKDEDEALTADVRVSFDKGGSWSAIGIDALKISRDQPTVNLGFFYRITKLGTQKEAFLKRTLHLFGHVLGLAHEWDGGRQSIERIKEKYGDNAAVAQHTQAFASASRTSNFPAPDENSIMAVFTDEWKDSSSAKQPTDGSPDGYLSKKDAAWLSLIYPGRVSSDDEENGILHALNVLGVPLKWLPRILQGSTVSEIRHQYHEFISEEYKDRLGAYVLRQAISSLQGGKKLEDVKSEHHVLKGKVSGTTPLIDHTQEDDLYDSVAAAVLNPNFHQVIANAVDANTDVQHFLFGGLPNPTIGYGGGYGIAGRRSFPGSTMSGINPYASPSTADPDVQNFLPFIAGAALPFLLKQIPKLFSGLPVPDGLASGINPYEQNALPPHIQQGIFDAMIRILKSDTTKNILIGAAKGAAERAFGGNPEAEK